MRASRRRDERWTATRRRLAASALLLGLACAGRAPQPAARPTPATVLLVSLDGFRHDYLDRYDAPRLRRLAERGARAERLVPVYPASTFPNHYAMVTGLLAEHHGVVDNTMWDPELGAAFSMGDRTAVADERWWQGEPIWVTAEEQGIRTAPFFWPGSEAPIGGRRPTYWLPFDDDLPNDERVERVLGWLALPSGERPRFVTLYLSDVDDAGHRFGPEAPETAAAVGAVDRAVGRLVDGLTARGLDREVNLLVVSDHGMTAVSLERTIFLDDYLDLSAAERIVWKEAVGIWPRGGQLEELVRQTRQARIPHVRAYRREEIPARLGVRGHRRTPPLVLLPDEGWLLTTRDLLTPERAAKFGRGRHGYDIAYRSMHGIFLAYGPAFVPGARVEELSAVDLYPLMARLLDVPPEPNDGDPAATLRLLRAALRSR